MRIYKDTLEGIDPIDLWKSLIPQNTEMETFVKYGEFPLVVKPEQALERKKTVSRNIMRVFHGTEQVGYVHYNIETYINDEFVSKIKIPKTIIVISFIRVFPQHMRRGIGSYMVEWLLKKYKIDYSTQLFWHSLLEDGEYLKTQFDKKYGENIYDTKWRQVMDQGTFEELNESLVPDNTEVTTQDKGTVYNRINQTEITTYETTAKDSSGIILGFIKYTKIKFIASLMMHQLFNRKIDTNPILFIQYIEVKPEFRRRGIGRLLINRILDDHKALGPYNKILFWGELFEDGKQLKKQFDQQFGMNQADEDWRRLHNKSASLPINEAVDIPLTGTDYMVSDESVRTNEYLDRIEESRECYIYIDNEDQDVVAEVYYVVKDNKSDRELEDFLQRSERQVPKDFGTKKKEVVIEWISVRPKYRRQGIGSAVIEYLLKRHNIPYGQLYWHRLFDDGAQLKAQFDAKYGENLDDDVWRKAHGYTQIIPGGDK